MKEPRALLGSGRTGLIRLTLGTTLWVVMATSGIHGQTDPNLFLSLQVTNQAAVVSWFGSNAVPYQVESSSNLTLWAEASPVIPGVGAVLWFTNSLTDPNYAFYRVKRLIPQGLVFAEFNPATGILTITGDEHNNLIAVDRDAYGHLRVNNGAVPITGGVATVANTVLVQIFGGDGHDVLSLNEVNGALPRAQLQGDAGNDTLTGGSGNDILTGGPGNDILLGRGGSDSLLGGDDHDIVEGGDGNDIATLGAGNDRFVWNPGDDTDTVDGGEDNDLVEVNGSNGAEQFTVVANGTRVRFDRIDPAPFSLDIGTCEFLVLNANGGNDSFSDGDALITHRFLALVRDSRKCRAAPRLAFWTVPDIIRPETEIRSALAVPLVRLWYEHALQEESHALACLDRGRGGAGNHPGRRGRS